MDEKKRRRLMRVFRVIAVILAAAMILGIISQNRKNGFFCLPLLATPEPASLLL